MKSIFTIGILLFLLSGCNKQPREGRITLPVNSQESMIIDHPAAIVLKDSNANKHSSWAEVQKKAQKILSPLQIPMIPSRKGNLEFVKNNGDVVRLNINAIASHYQLILFNAVNDPMPCNFSDLKSAARYYFNKNQPVTGIPHQNIPVSDLRFSPDSTTKPFVDNGFSLQERKPKKIILYQRGDDILKWKPRAAPGIEYVISKVDQLKVLEVSFENDLITFANTDRYFTNGITLKLQAPWISSMRVSSLMIPYQHAAVSKSSLILVQNMYTPTDTRYAPALKDDRPYASYLYLGYRRTSTDKSRKLEFSTELDLGFTGPYSPGSYFQTLVHKTFPTNDKPLGWETQIKSDPIINYSVGIDKIILEKDHLVLSAGMEAKLGTLYTQTGAVFKMLAGRNISPFNATAKNKDRWQYFWYLKTNGSIVGYDATMQGGLFNKDNIFVLNSSEVSRFVATAETGLHLSYKDTGIELAQHFLSPEYKGGMFHKWGRISLLFKL